MSPALLVRKELPVREDCGYIRPGAASESPFHDLPVTGSHLFGSAVCRVLGLWTPHLLFGLKPWTLVGDFRLSGDPGWWCTMQSGTGLPVVDQAEAASAARNPLPGTFRGFELDLQSDRLYDLDSTIPDVIGLQAIQPGVAVIKVMSIPDNRCIQVMIPDDHVPNEFHEVLIHDMEEEEPPFVALSDLGCLRLDWPYLHLWDVICWNSNVCAGSAGICGKYIQQNIGRHVACYHMELAQLWRCLVTWCTVWRGTPQDCIDHMRKAHNSGLLSCGLLSPE